MSKVEMMVDELKKLTECAKCLGGTPEEFFQHMQGHRTELSLVLSAFDIANNADQIIKILEQYNSNSAEIKCLMDGCINHDGNEHCTLKKIAIYENGECDEYCEEKEMD